MWHFILLKNYYVRRELKKQAHLDCRWVFSATLLLHLLPWLGTSVSSSFLNGILRPLGVGEHVFMTEHSSSVHKS